MNFHYYLMKYMKKFFSVFFGRNIRGSERPCDFMYIELRMGYNKVVMIFN